MAVVLAVLVVLAVVVVLGLVIVGRETATLRSQPKQALFDIEEAVDFVADAVPGEVSARISYDDVRALVRWHLEHLAAAGNPVNRWDAGRRLVVVDDEEGAEVLMARAVEAGLPLEPADVAAVLAAELAYFEAIGAIGPAVPEPLELLAAEEEAKGALGPGTLPGTEERRWSS